MTNRAGALERAEPEEAAPEPISRHLVAVSSALRRRVAERLQARGHALSLPVTQLVPKLPVGGMGMSALAGHAELSLQRTGQLVQQLEDDGYVQRVPGENDRRARRVVYTNRGRRLLRDIAKLQDEISDEFKATLGAERFEALLSALRELDVALNGDDTGLQVAPGA